MDRDYLPIDRCWQTAMLFSRLSPMASSIFVAFFVPAALIACTAYQEHLDSKIGTLKRELKTDEERHQRDNYPPIPRHVTPSLVVPHWLCRDHSDTSTTHTADADTVFVPRPSSSDAKSSGTSPKATRKGDHTRRPRSLTAAMTPAQIRTLSQIFVQQTLLIFVLAPFALFLACLLINSCNFCSGSGRYPNALWHMLWVLLPGYLVWGLGVVYYWADTATLVMGLDDERREVEENTGLSAVQVVAALVVMPVVTVGVGLVVWAYRGLVGFVEGRLLSGRGGDRDERGSQAARAEDSSAEERRGDGRKISRRR